MKTAYLKGIKAMLRDPILWIIVALMAATHILGLFLERTA